MSRSPIEIMIDAACSAGPKPYVTPDVWHPAPWYLGRETKGGNVWVMDAYGQMVTLENIRLAERIVAAVNAHESQ